MLRSSFTHHLTANAISKKVASFFFIAIIKKELKSVRANFDI